MSFFVQLSGERASRNWFVRLTDLQRNVTWMPISNTAVSKSSTSRTSTKQTDLVHYQGNSWAVVANCTEHPVSGKIEKVGLF